MDSSDLDLDTDADSDDINPPELDLEPDLGREKR